MLLKLNFTKFNQKTDYFNDFGDIDVENYNLIKPSAIINGIYQVVFGQRKFVKENALAEFTKFYDKEVWIMILISMLTLSFVLSFKYWITLKKDFFSSFSSTMINLIGHFLLNDPGGLIYFQ